MTHLPWDQPSYSATKRKTKKKAKKKAKKKPTRKAPAKKKSKKKTKAKTRKRVEREDRWRFRKLYQAREDRFHPEDHEVIADLDRDVARGFVETHHYAGTLPQSAYTSGKIYGLYHKPSRSLVGVAAYGSPGGPKTLSSSFPNLEDLDRQAYDPETGEWYSKPITLGKYATELQRLVLLDEVPKNGESWFVSKTFDHLRGKKGVRGVVSFSDPHYGHVGTVYKALSAHYTGMSKPSYVWRYKATGTEVPRRGVITKIRAADPCHGSGKSISGWSGAIDQLVARGAPRPAKGSCLQQWLEAVLPMIATRERHGGKHRYVWGLTKGQEGELRQRLGPIDPGLYPKLTANAPVSATWHEGWGWGL